MVGNEVEQKAVKEAVIEFEVDFATHSVIESESVVACVAELELVEGSGKQSATATGSLRSDQSFFIKLLEFKFKMLLLFEPVGPPTCK